MPAAKGSIPWNAGTSAGWTDKRGYRWLYVTENGKRRARREHRVVMEKHLGRRLEPWEVVHHKDGNPTNNCLENLEVVEFGMHTSNHHTGSRKSYDARKSMEAFALLREELKFERSMKADLLQALRALLPIVESLDAQREEDEPELPEVVTARAAIARATGQQE